MQYTLREAVQNRILWVVLFFAVLGVGGAAFVGDLAIYTHLKSTARWRPLY